MRQLYTSPRQENIDRVVTLMSEQGIETKVMNRSNWNRPTYQRFSYTRRENQPGNDRDSWPQVWICHADDYTRARALLRELGIEPTTRHAEELAAARDPSPVSRRRHTVARVRRIVLLAIGAVFVLAMLRSLHLL
jgi:ferric-dicitrate binding protein FerR (iron transport regulator)